MPLEPFTVHVDQDVLDDLRLRLLRTRFTTPSDSEPGRAGFDPAYLRELVDRWADGFDWRAREAELNRYPQFRTTGEAPVHFVHARGAIRHAFRSSWPTAGRAPSSRCFPSSTC